MYVDCVSWRILANLGVHMSSDLGVIMPLTARAWKHTASQNVTGEETEYGQAGDSNRLPFAYHTSNYTTKLMRLTHGQPATISLCLIRFIPETMLKSWIQSVTHSQTWTNNELQRGGKLSMILAPAEDRTSVPPHANPNLDRITLKAGLNL